MLKFLFLHFEEASSLHAQPSLLDLQKNALFFQVGVVRTLDSVAAHIVILICAAVQEHLLVVLAHQEIPKLAFINMLLDHFSLLEVNFGEVGETDRNVHCAACDRKESHVNFIIFKFVFALHRQHERTTWRF